MEVKRPTFYIYKREKKLGFRTAKIFVAQSGEKMNFRNCPVGIGKCVGNALRNVNDAVIIFNSNMTRRDICEFYGEVMKHPFTEDGDR